MMDGGDSESEVPEVSDPRNQLVTSGDSVDFEYELGIFESTEPACFCSIIVVAEVDSRLLVAFPEGAWHRKRAKRAINPNSIAKAVQVSLKPASAADREQPESSASLKVWLGILNPEFEGQVSFGNREEVSVTFPETEPGVYVLPYAQALVAVARDHFTFLSAESGIAPPGLDPVPVLQQRVQQLEGAIAGIQEGIKELLNEKKTAPPSALKAKPKTSAKQQRLPAGVDQAVASQALQAGVSPQALAEMAAVLGLPEKPQADPVRAAVAGESSEEEDGDALPDGGLAENGGGSGSADPMVQALVKLTSIVDRMDQDKKTRGKGLDRILDRADSGLGASSSVSSSRTKAGALRALQQLLVKDPKLIYQSLEQHLQEDWELGGAQPGVLVNTITARGWLEHRSRIQSYQSAIRPAWIIAGIWDSLRQNKVEEARARAGLGLAMLDQQGCDSGGWLIASEMSLEAPPPYGSFLNHSPPSAWETPHTKLVDSRFFDLLVSKLKDLAEFHEKKGKLGGNQKTRTEDPPVKRPDPKKGGKGAGKKGNEAKETDAATQQQ